LWVPEEVKTERVISIAVLGLIVNLVGLFAFDHAHHHHGHACSHSKKHDDNQTCSHSHDTHHHHPHHDSKHDNLIIYGMFLHILADTLGSVGVIISSLLISNFGWTWTDPLCSIFIAVLILVSMWPLLIRSGGALLMVQPVKVRKQWPFVADRVI